MRMMTFVVASMLLLTLSGCAKMLNPYENNFKCPKASGGLCTDLSTAYDIATGKVVPSGDKKNPFVKSVVGGEDVARFEYNQSVYKELRDLIDQPQTPMVAPPRVLRILVVPYKDDSGALMTARHIYMLVDEPKWVLGDYLPAAN